MTEAKEEELEEEAEWIYNAVFIKQTISLQVMIDGLHDEIELNIVRLANG